MNIYEQCWTNAYASPSEYRVPATTQGQAVSFRAQCHRWRRKIAESVLGDRYEDYPLYDLEVTIEGPPYFVVFRKRARIVLPPVEGVSFGLWCLIQRPEGIAIEQRSPPFTGLEGFIEAYDTQEQAEKARAELLKPKGPIFASI